MNTAGLCGYNPEFSVIDGWMYVDIQSMRLFLKISSQAKRSHRSMSVGRADPLTCH
jgi:hypothetical protein